MCSSDIFLGILAILFPPVAVWIKTGLCTADSLINLALCCLGYFPGLLHAWYIIAKNPETDESYEYEPIHNARNNRPRDAENGHATHYYVQQPQGNGHGHRREEYGATGGRVAPPPPPPGSETRPQHDQRTLENHHGLMAQQGESSDSAGMAPPPSYSEVVRGDHKIQSHQ